MSDAKVGGPIEKSNLLGIISALQLWLWVIQKNAKMPGWSPALLSLVVKYVCWCSRLQVCLRGVFFKVSKKNYSRSRFLASKRRIRRPHVIPRCTFIGLFVAWMIHVKKHSGYKIRQNQSSLSDLG